MEDTEIEVKFVPAPPRESPEARAKEKNIVHHQKDLFRHNHTLVALIGTCGVILWILLFSLGMLIDSSSYRAALRTNFNFAEFLMTMLTFTPTNIALLCLVSAFTGGCSSLLVISKAEKALGLDKQTSKTSSHIYMSENPFSSMLRGIVVFFAFLAGVIVTSSNAFSNPTAQAYTQAAGIVSLLAFIVGYDPTMFRSLISVAEKLKGENEKPD